MTFELTTFLDWSFSLLTLTFLEVVLGIDNLIFLSVIANRLPVRRRKPARVFGLLLALFTRLCFLAGVVWLTKLTQPLFHIGKLPLSVKDMFLCFGSLFLLVKSTREIHAEFHMAGSDLYAAVPKPVSFFWVILQIALLDIIFSFDSIITAIGLTQNFTIMVTAITIAIFTMIFLSEPLGALIDKYPTLKMLALSFLLLIGTILLVEAFHFHVPRGYVYFAICFSLSVEILNILVAKRRRRLEKKPL